ncbi:hypothetical protein CUJ84_Chr001778 [Rhizobium leguminosarum]|uniref:Uncharacterized protein n=1 Tax=Rhizobium leguminosarum TaxID=384 RepID=A0A2K9Z1Q0_RHILE|nr:hypothetical protein CUJ84_Chr001778 [Rhizobium leguminosarum]
MHRREGRDQPCGGQKSGADNTVKETARSAPTESGSAKKGDVIERPDRTRHTTLVFQTRYAGRRH